MADSLATKETSDFARPIHPQGILDRFTEVGITHVITVPDTHQKSLLALLKNRSEPKLITACTEDEAMGMNLGLYIGGMRPLLLIQNAGFYASMNSLRGLALDGRVPTCLLIGEFLRDPKVPSNASEHRVVHLMQPTLEAWKIPFYRLDDESDLPNFSIAYEQARRDRGPVAVLVGAATAAL